MDYDELRKFIGLCNRRYSSDLNFVGLFHKLLSRFFKDNQGFIERFHRLIIEFRNGKCTFQLLKIMGEYYGLAVIKAIKEYSVGAEGQSCYSENKIWISNVASTTVNLQKDFNNMEATLFHEIIHILIYKTGHQEKNREKFVDGLSTLIHDYYKTNVEAV